MSDSNNIIHVSSNTKLVEASNLINALTDNGDLTFGSMGEGTPSSAIMELDHSMVLPVKKHICIERNNKGFCPPYPDMGKMDEGLKTILDERFQTFIDRTTSLDPNEQAKWWSLMFRYTFYLRNLRGEGKRARMLFYYLLEKMNDHFPNTMAALVHLVPHYGYFGDLNNIINNFNSSNKGKNIVKAAVDCFVKNLDADCMQIFGKTIKEVTLGEAKSKNDELKSKTILELTEMKKGKCLSLAAKWFKREGKKDSYIPRQLIIASLYPQLKEGPFNEMRLRHIISAISQLLQVGEQMMCSEIYRDWDDIIIDHAPAKFVTKYRKALLNEDLKNVLREDEMDTGNRSKRFDRIECRKNTLKSILAGKLKGANQDLWELSKIIMGHLNDNSSGSVWVSKKERNRKISSSLSFGERQLINQQWNDMVNNVKALIEEVAKEHIDDADYIDPRNVIPVIDTSGSMNAENVQDIAIGLGIMASTLSNIPNCLISFSDKPEIFHLNEEDDVFDKFLTICNGPTGLNTNIDATYRVLLDLMVKKKVEKVNYAMLFLTDGMFDSGLVYFEDDVNESYETQEKKFENVFIGRMEKAFIEKGYTLPRTIFWNLNGKSLGFSATESTKGIQMVSGFSQTLMKQVFTGDYKLEVDQETGNTRVSVDPWTAFVKAITSDTFSPVLKVVLATGEGVMKTLVPSTPITDSVLPDLSSLIIL